MAENRLQALACETTNTTRPDGPLLDAWDRRNAAWARYEALPDTDLLHTNSAEAECIAIADAAEEIIRIETAATPRGVAIQLWLSLSHTSDASQRSVSELVNREDLASLLSQEDEFDYSTRMHLAALRSLASMGAN